MQPVARSVTLLLFLVASLGPQLSIGLVPEPRIEEQNSSKYPSPKQYNLLNEPANNPHYSIYEEQPEDENRIIIREPYKTLLQTTARIAVAQSSLTDYVSVDTFMDVVSGTTYALSKPSNLGTALKTIAVMLVTILTGAFIVPASIIQNLGAILRNPEHLLKLEKHLPGGLNEMGIISLLNEKTEDLLLKLRLNDSACRELTVCRTGELISCSFPRASKVTINFLKENFSKLKSKISNKYFNAFLAGFVDQNCAYEHPESDNNSAHSRSCASNFLYSLSSCSLDQKSNSVDSNSSPASSKLHYQSIRTPRAQN